MDNITNLLHESIYNINQMFNPQNEMEVDIYQASVIILREYLLSTTPITIPDWNYEKLLNEMDEKISEADFSTVDLSLLNIYTTSFLNTHPIDEEVAFYEIHLFIKDLGEALGVGV